MAGTNDEPPPRPLPPPPRPLPPTSRARRLLIVPAGVAAIVGLSLLVHAALPNVPVGIVVLFFVLSIGWGVASLGNQLRVWRLWNAQGRWAGSAIPPASQARLGREAMEAGNDYWGESKDKFR